MNTCCGKGWYGLLVLLATAMAAPGGTIFDNYSEGWPSKASLPSARYSPGYATWNDSLYVVGGVNSQASNSVFRYDGGTNWTICADIPQARSIPGIFSLGSYLFCAGGSSSASVAQDTVYRYDGTSWATVNSLPSARHAFGCAVLNGKAYVIGGSDASASMVDTTYCFDGTNWTTAASLPATRYCAFAATLGNTLYYMGGLFNGGVQTSSILKFDGTSWTSAGNMPAWRYNPAVCVQSNKILVIGGKNAGYANMTNIYAFDGTNWTEQVGLSSAFSDAAAGVVSNQLFVAGGYPLSAETRYYRAASTGVSPAMGDVAGGYSVAIMGSGLGNGSDITNVTLCGVQATILAGQTATSVVVTAGASGAMGSGDVRVFSASQGETVKSNIFYYSYNGALFAIYTDSTNWTYEIPNGAAPTSTYKTDFDGVEVGQTMTNELAVTENSGNGTLVVGTVEITGTGAAAFSVEGMPTGLTEWGYSNILVRFTPPSAGVHTASVVIANDAFPNPYILNLSGRGVAFEPGLVVLGTNGASVASGDAAQSAKGTKFRPLMPGASWTNTFAITNNGAEALSISGYGISGARFEVSGLPASVAVGGVSNFTVRFAPDAIGSFAGALTISNDSPTAAYVVNLAGSGYAASTNIGPFGGGNTITITNGYFGTITNVIIGATSMSPLQSGSNWFTIVMPVATTNGPVDIIVQASDEGDTTLANAYTYNPAGEIGAATKDWTRWDEVAGLPVQYGRYNHAAAVLNNALYVMGGDAPGGAKTNVYKYNGTNWAEVAGLPATRDSSAAAVLNGALYLVGGNATNVYRYDGTNWTQVAGLPAARRVLAAATLNGALYAVGGYSGLATTYKYNGTNWTTVTALPLGRDALTATTLNGALYAVGGENGSGVLQTNVYQYNGTAWAQVAGLPVATMTHAADVLNSALYVVGGVTNASTYEDTPNVYEYDGTSWTTAAGLPVSRHYHTVSALNGSLYSVGGISGGGGGATTNVFRYPAIAGGVSAAPSSGSYAGGYQVIINGVNLGSGTDITNVTLCGISASILTRSATQIVVTAGAATAAGTGDVRVFSTSYGETVKSNAFEYLRASQAALAFAPASPQTYGTTNGLSTTGGSGTGAVGYAVSSGPGLIVGGTSLVATAGSGSIVVVATKAQDDLYFARASTATVAAAKADQTIDFPAIGDKVATDAVGLAATASSGLAISFAVGSGPASIAGGTNLTFSGMGDVSIVASQAGDTNWNAAADATNTFNVTKASATVYLQGLSQTYDGTVRTITATTMPAGLTVEITYDGSASAPTNAGTYAVTGTVNDVMYQGFAADSLVVAPADQTIAFGAIGDQFWTNELGLAATASSGLGVTFAVESGLAAIAGGTNLTFTGCGEVVLTASQAGDANWNAAPAVTNIFDALGPQVLSIGTNGVYYASGEDPATVAGTDFGEAIIGLQAFTNTFRLANTGTGPLAISGVATNGAGAGSFALLGAPTDIPAGDDAPFQIVFAPQAGGALAADFRFAHNGTGTVFVLKVAGTGLGGGIELETNALAFSATYQGADPAEQTVGLTNIGISSFTYTNVVSYGASASGWLSALPNNGTVALGGATILTNFVNVAGINAGVHSATVAVTAVDATNSPQMVAVTLTVAMASQTTAFPAIGDQLTTDAVGLSATASSGLAVSFAVGSGPASIAGGTNLTFSGTGSVSIVAAQGGDTNWNAAPDVTNTFNVTKDSATVFLLDLAQVYDGTARTIAATTMPAGLTVEFTYDGNAWAPTNAGTYAVTGTVDDAMYQGFATNSLTVAMASQTIAFPAIGDRLTTDAVGLAATASSGLAVSFAVGSGPASIAGGTDLTFSGTGSVSIVASQAGNGNWNAALDATNSFNVTKDSATVFLLDLAQVYDGTARTISATTMPAGLTVEFTYDGNAWAPTNAGTYAVTGTVNEAMYQGSAADTLTVERALDMIVFGDTNQTYDGTARAVTATAGSGSPVALTYDGSATAPVDVGTYAVTGVVDAANWTSTNTATLTVGKADQTIVNFLPADGEMFDLFETAAISAQALSGGAVEFTNLTPAIATLAGTDITFIKPGLARVEASQAGDANWNPVSLVHGWRVMNSQNALCDFDGDGRADLAVYNAASGNWYIKESSTGNRRVVQWGWSQGLPVPGDYDGDGVTDVAVYHPASGNWFMAGSTAGARYAQWGWGSAVPVPGDYDGDGTTDVAVYDPILLSWHLRMSAAGDQTVTWGLSNSVPVPADYDGDGRTDLAVYQPMTGTWSIRYRLPDMKRPSERTVQWGWGAAVPVPGDYDGDGTADIAVFHRATGNWYLLCSATGIRIESWGWAGTTPVAADYDGDGATDIPVYHQAAGNWYVLESESGLSSGAVPFGWSAARPVLLQPLIHSWFGLP